LNFTRVTEYLGFDHFINLALGIGKGKESSFAALLAPDVPAGIGQRILKATLAQGKITNSLRQILELQLKLYETRKTIGALQALSLSKEF
jgi:hypothetical protein